MEKVAREPESCTKELAALVEHALLDDLVRLYQQRRRDRQAERLRSLEVDDQLELSRFFNGQVAGPSAFENLVYVGGPRAGTVRSRRRTPSARLHP